MTYIYVLNTEFEENLRKTENPNGLIDRKEKIDTKDTFIFVFG